MKTRSGYNYSYGSDNSDYVPLYVVFGETSKQCNSKQSMAPKLHKSNANSDCNKNLESIVKKGIDYRRDSEHNKSSDENLKIKKLKQLLTEKDKQLSAIKDEMAKTERNERYNRRQIEELQKEVSVMVSTIKTNTQILDNNNKLLETINSELTCGICKELFIYATVINCGHSFCFGCIDQWKSCSVNSSCPVCREPISLITRQLCLDNIISAMVDKLKPHLKPYRQISMNEISDKIEMFDTIRRVAHALPNDSDGSDADSDGDNDVFESSDQSDYLTENSLISHSSSNTELRSSSDSLDFIDSETSLSPNFSSAFN